MSSEDASKIDASTLTLLPINPADHLLMSTMTGPTSPRWMKVAACLALEGRRLVLVKDGVKIHDPCRKCGADEASVVRAFHKNDAGGDPRALVECGSCGELAENSPLILLEKRAENRLSGVREVF